MPRILSVDEIGRVHLHHFTVSHAIFLPPDCHRNALECTEKLLHLCLNNRIKLGGCLLRRSLRWGWGGISRSGLRLPLHHDPYSGCGRTQKIAADEVISANLVQAMNMSNADVAVSRPLQLVRGSGQDAGRAPRFRAWQG
jgi:hypothetical protein